MRIRHGGTARNNVQNVLSKNGRPPLVYNVVLHPALIRRELGCLLDHALFAKAKVLREIVAFLVESTLRKQAVDELALAEHVFDIPPAEFHPYKNANVRVQMRNLRLKLDAFYLVIPDVKVKFKLVGYEIVFEIPERVPAEARRALNEARYLLDSRFPEDLILASKTVERILKATPHWATAWETLNYLRVSMAVHGAGQPRQCLELAGEAADHALHLAPNSGQAHAAKASVEALLHWKWDEAERLYERALTLDPRVKFDGWYQVYLIATARQERAAELIEESMSVLDRPSASFQTNLGVTQYLCRRLDVAEIELQRAHKLNPDDWSCLAWLALVQWNRGDHVKAVFTQTKAALAARRSPPQQYFEMSSQGILGTPRTIGLVDEHCGGVSEIGVMVTATIFHNWNRAIDSLERMYETRYPLAHFLARTPLFDPLWGVPRFRELVAQVGIPSTESGARAKSA